MNLSTEERQKPMPENITTEGLPGANVPDVAASGAEVAGSETAAESVEVKDLMKTLTGKEFPTNEAAIKSLQDTYKFATQQGEIIKDLENKTAAATAQAVSPELAAQIKTLETAVRDSNFYAANPVYNTPEAKLLIAKFGGNPEDVVNDEVFKTAFTAISKTAEMEQSQSVLHSNPRLGQAQDNMTKAAEALKTGDDVAAATAATAAVLEAYGLN